MRRLLVLSIVVAVLAGAGFWLWQGDLISAVSRSGSVYFTPSTGRWRSVKRR